ncbi:MAG: hypothetical protein ACOYNY_36280 [Caldilineaceae bacterium]
MRKLTWFTWTICSLLLFGLVTPVNAQTPPTVRFLRIKDAVPLKYYNPATTAPDPANRNRLIIGFHTGIDPNTLVNTAFVASSEAFYRPMAMDTLSFQVTAPTGFYIAKLTYAQTGSRSTSRGGGALGAGNWVVNGVGADLGTFAATPTITRTLNLTGQNKTSLSVAISNSLFAHGVSVSSGTIAITSASVLVELLPLPAVLGAAADEAVGAEEIILLDEVLAADQAVAKQQLFLPLIIH